jgi:hypothetical protein
MMTSIHLNNTTHTRLESIVGIVVVVVCVWVVGSRRSQSVASFTDFVFAN